MSEVISQGELRRLVETWMDQGKRVAGPGRVKPDLVLYRFLAAADDLLLEGFLRPQNSIKPFVFPRHERLYGYRRCGKQIELYDVPPPADEQVIVGARPCDAAALPILDHVFNWDCADDFYNHRRRLTAVVTLACARHDAHCFCTSVGVRPDDERGSDVVLADLGDGTYEVRSVTDKGRDLFAGRTQPSDRVGRVGPGPEKWLDPAAVAQILAADFESPHWASWALRCLGCGQCAYTCPTCHCFDIVDEVGPGGGGVRVRNWDACQFPMFTAHASGHNPRSVQAQRQRQRITHKFRIYPEKFGDILCTGCGNCTRGCPVGLGVRPVLEAIQDLHVPHTVETAP